MAEKDDVSKLSERLGSVKLSGDMGDVDNPCICCICQEPCVNPVELPCSHVFCYLCIKGVAARNSHCALCRHRITRQVLDNPSVVNKAEIKNNIKKSSKSEGWYYEARNGGWWLYEQRASAEIERAYRDSEKTVQLQISGFQYVVDLENMVQYREGMPNRRRQIKRDKISEDAVKGVAGIAIVGSDDNQERHEDEEEPTNSTSDSTHSHLLPSDETEHQQPPPGARSRLVTGHD